MINVKDEESEKNDNIVLFAKQKPQIFFITVTDNAAKLKAICDVAAELIFAGKRLLILAPNQQAAAFVDGLLWRIPEESFLPHSIADSETQERCVITTKDLNMNAATALLNLCPNIPVNFRDFEIIYELWDETDPAKTALSASRKKAYGES